MFQSIEWDAKARSQGSFRNLAIEFRVGAYEVFVLKSNLIINIATKKQLKNLVVRFGSLLVLL